MHALHHAMLLHCQPTKACNEYQHDQAYEMCSVSIAGTTFKSRFKCEGPSAAGQLDRQPGASSVKVHEVKEALGMALRLS